MPASGGGLPPTAWPPAPYGYYPAPLPPPATQRNHKGQVAVVASLVAVVALLLGATIGHATWPTDTTGHGPDPSSGGTGSSGGSNFPFGSGGCGSASSADGSGSSTTGAGAPSDVTGIASKVSPALVDINTNLSYQNEQAAGTGIVLTSNGEVLTNNHVIDGATSISVTDIGNSQTYKANVVGYDRTGDVAVIQLVGAVGPPDRHDRPGHCRGGRRRGRRGQRRRHRWHAQFGRRLGHRTRPVDHRQRQRRRQLGEPDRPHRDELRHPARRLGRGPGQRPTARSSAWTRPPRPARPDSGGAAQAYAIPIGTALSVAKSIEAGRASSTIHIGATGFLGIQVQDSSSSGSDGSCAEAPPPGAVGRRHAPGSPGAGAGLAQGDVITGVDSTPVDNSSDLSPCPRVASSRRRHPPPVDRPVGRHPHLVGHPGGRTPGLIPPPAPSPNFAAR